MVHDPICHQPEAHPDAELIDGLEPDQIAAATARPLPRMEMGREATVGLWGVRIFVLAMSALVTYTFVFSILYSL